MIYLGFIFDYLLLFFCPIKSYFVISNIDKNDLFSIVVVGLILDCLYMRVGLNLIVLLLIYFLLKIIRINKKYYLFKETIIYLLYFSFIFIVNGMNSKYFVYSFGLQLIYILLGKWLLNRD